jgi:similar to stage IV sporulation protein
MPLQKLWSYAQGYVIIKIKGSEVEKFLGRAVESGLVLWNVKRVQRGFLMACMNAQDFAAIRSVARATGCRVEIWAKRGFPFLGRKLLKRPALVVGVCVLLALVAVLSSRVWVIRIEGIKTLDKAYLEQSIRDLGLVVGAKKADIDTKELENNMLLRIPELAWIGIRMQGSVATVEVVEKVIAPKGVTRADLVAAKPGLIHNLIVLSGEAVVKQGDTVIQGDCLIRGIEKDGQYARPRGIVQARVWYEGRRKVLLNDTVQLPTGREKTFYYTKMGNNEYRVWPISIPFANYEVSGADIVWEWSVGGLRVQVLAKKCEETVTLVQNYTTDEAVRIATTTATSAVLAVLPQTIEIIEQSVEVTEFQENGRNGVQARVVIEVIEEIGTYDTGGVSLN